MKKAKSKLEWELNKQGYTGKFGNIKLLTSPTKTTWVWHEKRWNNKWKTTVF